MSVSSQHPEYKKNLERWCLVRDVVNSDVKQYIQDVDPSDRERCARYKSDAVFANFTGRTKSGLVGNVFSKDVKVDLPTSVEYLKYDATGTRQPLVRLAQEVVGEVLQAGRYGLLVDYPASEDGLTAEEVANLNLSARIIKYRAESIINWYTSKVNGVYDLCLVVIKECNSVLADDGYSWEPQEQYRVLKMVDGNYVQQLYNKKEELVYEYYPRDFNGDYWTFIPFIFVGSEDNDSAVDASPLYDLAELNIGHLRNSADYEESIHIAGQPTLIISSGMSSEEFVEANPGGVRIGARRGLNLGPAGTASMLQAQPNQVADVAMQRKETQAVMLGARLIQSVAQNETAEAARIRYSGENSVLSSLIHNVNDAINKCIDWCMKFMSAEDTSGNEEEAFEINSDVLLQTADAQLIMAQLQLYNSSIIAVQDVRQSLRNSGVLPEERSDEAIDADLSNINPLL